MCVTPVEDRVRLLRDPGDLAEAEGCHSGRPRVSRGSDPWPTGSRPSGAFFWLVCAGAISQLHGPKQFGSIGFWLNRESTPMRITVREWYPRV
jgi:hypothetical protein